MQFNEARFELQVRNAICAAQKVLDGSKDFRLPSEVGHAYRDKYLLAEYSTIAALIGVLDCLTVLGLDNLAQLRQQSGSQAVTIRFSCKETCDFEREQTCDVESDVTTVHINEERIGSYTVTTTVEYWWRYCYSWEISVYLGTNPENAIRLTGHKAETPIKTASKYAPRPAVRMVPPVDLNLVYLIQQLPSSGGLPRILIDRSSPECHTPSRNPQITAARDFFDELHAWAKQVSQYFTSIDNHDQGLPQANAAKLPIFCPLLPVFEPALEQENKQADSETNVLLQDVVVLLQEQQRSTKEQFSILAKQFPAMSTDSSTAQLPSIAEAKVVAICDHIMRTAQLFSDVVDYIERLLYHQLIAALGQEITPKAFGEFMEYHNRSLLRPEYQPTVFAYSVRQAAHDPEGELSIEEDLKPISTIVRQQQARLPMGFNINAGTRIRFLGTQSIHACVRHQFSGQDPPILQVVARARRFSSYILVLGKVMSVEQFLPTHAIIVRDKDDLTIPLTQQTIPSAKEFAAAVRSLSPEQLRFVSAYRSMQLSSTLFAVCVLQIKPQLEKLLRLNRDSLTKEVELTQHLLELFIQYQIPSDLLAFQGREDTTTRCKLKRVQHSVERVRRMVSRAKRLELRDLGQKAMNQHLQHMFHDVAPQAESEGESIDEAALDEDEAAADEDEAFYEAVVVPLGVRTNRLSSRSASTQIQGRSREDRPPPMAKRKRRFLDDDDDDYVPIEQSERNCRNRSRSFPRDNFCRFVDDLAEENNEEEDCSDASSSPSPEEACEEKAEKRDEPEPEEEEEEEGQSEDEIDPDYRVAMNAPATPAITATLDFANFPNALESRLTMMDPDGALRPTILDVGGNWQQKRPQGLLGPVVSTNLGEEEQKREKNAAFDLLDALTRSGELPFEEASLHVLVCSTHCFDETVMDCLVKKNINPVEKVDRSTLVVASTVHELPPQVLLQPTHLEVAKMLNPQLFN